MKPAISALFSLLRRGTSPFHVAKEVCAFLQDKGFTALSLAEPWTLQRGGAYVVDVYGSTLVAFRIHENDGMLRLATAHTDYPCLRVKPSAEVRTHGYGKLNVEVYGGMIDRPSSFAGTVVLKGADPFHPVTRLVDVQRPILTIPRLAIHMNRNVNKGVELNPQKDMLPLMTMAGKKADEAYFLPFLAKTVGCSVDDILSYELTVYVCEEPCTCGLSDEFISSPRLDNLTSVAACAAGIAASARTEGIDMIALFDNEEVGSRTKQGAASLVVPNVLRRIYAALDDSPEAYDRHVAGGFFLSLDVAHALHPNAPEKNDITNFPVMNGGVVLKTACSQSYAGDGAAVAIVKALCQAAGVPYQQFVNRSDSPGGSTLGSILSAMLPMRTMDIGVPILAMHSARELMGADDQGYINELVKLFFS